MVKGHLTVVLQMVPSSLTGTSNIVICMFLLTVNMDYIVLKIIRMKIFCVIIFS